MALSPKEALIFQRDSDSDDLLWAYIRRFMSMLLMNPDGLSVAAGLVGAYVPEANEITLATQEARQPGRFRAQVLAQVYDNIQVVFPAVSTADELMSGLRDGSLHGDFMSALVGFSPKVAEVLVGSLPEVQTSV